MTWEDILFTAGQGVLFLALLPSVFSQHKPAFATSVITGVVLSSFAFAFFSLHLFFGGFAAILVSATWFVLAFQAYVQNRRKNRV